MKTYVGAHRRQVSSARVAKRYGAYLLAVVVVIATLDLLGVDFGLWQWLALWLSITAYRLIVDAADVRWGRRS